jgi:hypothetical protein
VSAVRPSRVLAVAAVLGLAAGGALSVVRGRRLEAEAARAEEKRAPRPPPKPKTYEVGGVKTFVDPEAVRYLPSYPGAVITDLAENTTGQGVAFKAGMFMTKDPLEDVIAYYRRELEKAGRFVVSQHWGDGAAYVGFYGPDKRMHTVAVMRSGSKTLTFLSNSDPEAFLRSNSAQHLDELPQMPDLTGELKFVFNDEGVAHSTFFAKAPDMPLKQAVDFYTQGLTKAGWRQQGETFKQGGRERMEFARPGQELSLTLSKDEKEPHVAVFANLLSHP